MSELEHPCKQTCSGWKQGFEAGAKEAIRLVQIHAEGGNIENYSYLSDYLDELLPNASTASEKKDG